MAISKKGIDYYPRDVGMMRDRKFNKARQKFGYVVYVIYDALLEMIYGDKGYYIVYNDKTRDEVIWELQDYCRGKYSVDEATICDVIEMLTECGLFSGDCYKQGIITSRRIQEVYYRTTVERRNVVVSEKIWLLSEEEMRGISSKSSILQLIESHRNMEGCSEDVGEEKRENVGNTGVNGGDMKQSKKEEIKGKGIKEYEIKGREMSVDSNIKKAYRECFKQILEPGSKDERLIREWMGKYDKELICLAFNITRERGKCFIAYTEGILKKWGEEGVRDYVDYLFGSEGEV